MIVALGQSNNQGEGCCYNSSVDFGYANMVQYVIGDGYSDSQYTTGIAAATGKLVQATEPMYDGGSNRANLIGSLVALGRNFVNSTLLSAQLVLVQAAVGGTSIEQWLNGLLTRAVNAATYANSLTGDTTNIAMFTYVQGESDAEPPLRTDPASFQSQLIQLINISRAIVGASFTTPFIIGSMVPEWVTTSGVTDAPPIANVHRVLPSIVPYTAYVNMPLGYVDCVETIHYSATGQRIMGAMMAQAYYRALVNANPALVPNHPTGLSVTLGVSGRYTLTWTAPSSPLTSYAIIYAPYINLHNPGGSCLDGSSAPPSQLLTNAVTTSFTLPFVLTGSYQFDVAAANGVQISSGSASTWVLASAS